MRRDLRRFVGCTTYVLLSAVACGGRPGGHVADVPVAPAEAVAIPAPPAPPTLAGARMVPTADGALVMDADSGVLFAVDREGNRQTHLKIASGAGLVAYDPASDIAFVADRWNDRVVVVDVSGRAKKWTGMKQLASWPTPAEPFGIAITPDRATVLVTTIADRTLVAFDAHTGAEQWRAPLAPEPRGIAVSADGARALVSSITSGAIDHVALAPPHRVTSIPFRLECDLCRSGDMFVRGSGAVVFLDAQRAVASYQREVPASDFALTAGRYGGAAALPPVTHHLAFLSFTGDAADASPTQSIAQIPIHQPRSILWDAAGDSLFVVGLGTDTLLYMPGLTNGSLNGIETEASTATLQTGDACGPDGIVVGPEVAGRRDAMIWCSFSQSMVRVTGITARHFTPETRLVPSVRLANSSWTPDEHAGMVLFYRSAPELNADGALACATCHPDGRADGLAWQIGARQHQTPILAGRVADTAPYKWDGSDASLPASIATTVRRMNGRGLSTDQTLALSAYLHTLPPPRVPTRDPAIVARGAAVFDEAGCDTCHAGPRMTDRSLHTIPGVGAPYDTPSLIGLAASAPYYHDGSAETLDDVLRSYGIGREMADFGVLSLDQKADLKAFLETR